MEPTNRLRFVRREIGRSITEGNPFMTVSTTNVLQQWWGSFYDFPETGRYEDESEGEWRDVPIEDES